MGHALGELMGRPKHSRHSSAPLCRLAFWRGHAGCILQDAVCSFYCRVLRSLTAMALPRANA